MPSRTIDATEMNAIGSTPTISVVMPAYNEELYIGEALDSILARDGAPHQVIVIEDGWTDGRLRSSRLEAVSPDQRNRGAHGGSTGLREATGDFSPSVRRRCL